MIKQCEDCDGVGGWCSVCKEAPDNCDCEDDCEIHHWMECSTCSGMGMIEDDDGDDEEQENGHE